MGLRIRLGSDDDDDDGYDEPAWARDEDADDDETLREWAVSPPDLGGLFVRAALVCLVVTVLSMLALVVELIAASDELFVDQPHLEDPITAWVWLFALTGTALSITGYAVWSAWKQRQLKRQIAGPSQPTLGGALSKLNADSSECNAYEEQVKKTVMALVFAVIVGNLPARILLPL
ncbi:hypothetical protein [Natronolimnobius baerhuensis]|uniref:Uncharacterized protein n=1 Tax=Natronolimnobius baerhuensis TaxID=253108 RepID=A0A202E5Q2_9EURY|nr:hypothetical protein [Natronolimnobius baerhuensis]OVE83579.1 hypothetical protein B2G88_14170 [Natronolimnobius baerhuensis]